MTKYHPVLVTLHWLLAIMVIMGLFGGSQFLANTPNDDPQKLTGLFFHMGGGMAIGILMLIRLVLRLTTKKPAKASTGNGLLDMLASAAHWIFYLLVLGMVASGMAMANMAGLPEIVYFGSGEALPADFSVFGPRIGHGIIAKILMALIVLHIVGALYHQFIVKDGLFGRMWFGKRQG